MTRNIEQNKTLQTLVQFPRLVRAEACRRSLFVFMKEFWGEIIAEEPVFNWHLHFLCRELELLFDNIINRRPKLYDLAINIPPGTTKSTLCTVMFPSWCWIARNPSKPKKFDSDGNEIDFLGGDLRFITGSYSSPLSLEHSELSRDIIKSEKFQEYFPECRIRYDKDSKSNYKNDNGGQRFTTSVGSTVTGVHAHCIIVDDPLDPKQAISDTQRENANSWMTQTLSSRKVDKANTPTILIMQRLHKNDPTGELLDKAGEEKRVRHIVLPGDCSEYEVKPPILKKYYRSNLLDPRRLSRKVLDEMRKDLGSYGYAGQVGQDPRPREGAMFQKEYFEIVDAIPSGGTEWVRGWDLAGTTEKEAKSGKPAYTAGVLGKMVSGTIYIMDVKRFRASPNDVRIRMRNTASQDPEGTVQDFPQDPGQAGKDQAKNITSYLVGFNVRHSVESGDKVLRAEPLSAQAEAGNVKLLRGAWNEEYIDEITFFPNGFKDQVDASVRMLNRIIRLKDMGSGVVGGPAGFKQKRNNPDG